MKRTLAAWSAHTLLTLVMLACQGSAGSPDEAIELLTSVPKWYIEEIRVNDAVTFKDGKMLQQFGSVNFERYMETVEWKSDGTFSGVFKGETAPFDLKWTKTADMLTVGAGKPAASDWKVLPQEVDKKSFVMKTQSTAYDYPSLTTIALKFRSSK